MVFREGLTRLLAEAGHQLVAVVGDAGALLAAVPAPRPDLAIVEVRMQPTMSDARAHGPDHKHRARIHHLASLGI